MRFRQVFLILLATGVGYALGGSPFGNWLLDCWHMLQVRWLIERTTRSGAGAVPLLVAGFLLGQGLYLLVRRIIGDFETARARSAERVAEWEPALQLATRFGLHRYLGQCVAWAAEDPTARTQCLALFKLKGLGSLNDRLGTLATTRLLQRVAMAARQAAVPVPAPYIQRWLAQYFPRPTSVKLNHTPAPRYAARWSGATFAIAFRELDAIQAVSVARDLASFIQHELAEFEDAVQLTVSAGIAVGIPGASARGLVKAAVAALEHCPPEQSNALVTAVHDPSDVRTPNLQQMSGVFAHGSSMERRDPNADALDAPAPTNTQAIDWARRWGPSLGCILAALVILIVSAPASAIKVGSYPWPDTLDGVQVYDERGSRTVPLVRTQLAPVSALGWTLSDVMIVQPTPGEAAVNLVEIRVRITNGTPASRYVSALNFSVTDANKKTLSLAPQQMLRMSQGITGKWLKPGETWSGWLRTTRTAPITELVFEPGSGIRLILH